MLEVNRLLNDLIEKVIQNDLIFNSSTPVMQNYFGSFNAHEIASLIGKNPNVSKDQALYSLLYRNPTFKQLIDKMNRELNLNQTKKKVEDSVKLFKREITDIANAITIQSDDDLKEIIRQTIVSKLNANLDQTIISKIENEIKSEVFKLRGRILESQCLNEHEIDKNVKITKRNDKVYEHWCHYKTYKLIGKIDGMNENENCVIEVKNRMFKREIIPQYDYIQCVIYMKLTNKKKCYLIERNPDSTRRETLFEWSQEFFNFINNKLIELVYLIRKMTRKDLIDLIKSCNDNY